MRANKLMIAALLGSATILGACAADPYYDNYGYGYSTAPGPYYGYAYDDPYYYGPSVGLGFGYSRYDRNSRWQDRDGRWHDRSDRDAFRANSPSTRANEADIRNNGGTPLWSQGDTYRGTGRNYDPSMDHGQNSPG